MQKLTLNIIPFNHPSTKVEFGFYKEKKDGYYPLKKFEYPKSLWAKYEEELQDCKRLYSNFKDTADCDFIAEVDFNTSWAFANHYYTKSIYDFFLRNADAVNFGFVNDVEVWLKDSTVRNNEYTTYKKYSLRVQYANVSKGMELVVTFDGTSLVHKKSIAAFDNLRPELINKVLFENEIYSYQWQSQELKLNLDKVYPILSKTLLDELTIDRPFKREPNKYKPYLKEINFFYDTYLNTEVFKNIIPLVGNGYISINNDDPNNLQILKTKNSSSELSFGKGKGKEPKKDFLRLKPYKPTDDANVRFVFIYHKDDRKKYVTKLFSILRDGLKNGEYVNFPPMKDAIAQNFYMEESKGFEFTSVDTALQEITQQLSNFEKVDNTLYVAFYISPVRKDEKDNQRLMLYYKMKELFLNQGVTSQVIYKESLFNANFKWYLPNIAVALLAKINGIPWRLDTDTKDDLVVGVGAFYSVTQKTKYIGSTFCFNNDGTFQDFNCFNSNETEKLGGEISKAIMKYVVDNHKQAKRLVIHFYKKISKKDLEPIYDILHTFNWNIPVIIITINKTLSNDYVAFDLDSPNLMPLSGSIVPIGKEQYLLFNNTRYNTKETVTDNPFPIKLTFSSSDEEVLKDILLKKDLIDQVYQFSRMYWKSVRQQNLPVTIKYPEMVAEIYPFFKNDSLPPFGQKNLWFL
ncbi:Piwi domain-containing protein [Tenacibaculum haliotis]|uniref:Piwi domain-containing protein n=1 Tax=Tenacibaculum haliotis TaxID=1888914 RepID=UPI0021AF244C|nr:Piwi domain-containing protein [Tenacibaculum haliotis]MCT4698548.1 Piwi domain-containing protein [Tenacibaculum haliotis]